MAMRTAKDPSIATIDKTPINSSAKIGDLPVQIDKYEILGEIGRGAMGRVYKAYHPYFKRYVAIKEILPELAQDPAVKACFEEEVVLLAQLPAHPNIVMVRDAVFSEKTLYIVMDYIEGESLAELVYRGGVDSERGIYLLDQILAGLVAIHQQNIIHHDLKSHNIIVDSNDHIYITDFGIAELKRIQTRKALPAKSKIATAKYVAPEIIDTTLNKTGNDFQGDIYAAGFVAYELLLGTDRFQRAFPQIYQNNSEEVAERWLAWHTDLSCQAINLHQIDETIPYALANIVERMMAKNMAERYDNVNEIRKDLAAAQSSTSPGDGKPIAREDATVPLDRLKSSRNMAAPSPTISPGTIPRKSPVTAVNRESAQPANNSAHAASTSSNRMPFWGWGVIGTVSFITITIVVFLLLSSMHEGFSLLVRGAPPRSRVFIDNIRHGLSLPDGSIRIDYLKPGKRLVRVVNEGYQEYNTSVAGTDGETQIVIAQLAQQEKSVKSLPKEIDYQGAMILIPAGEFIMGDDNHLPNEKIAQPITLPDYYIDKFEVTNAQYRQFCEATRRALPVNPWWDEQYFNNANMPVVGITWNDANAYAQWAGKRLPSEPEWEKAASWNATTGKKNLWPWGDQPDLTYANLNTNHPSPVGQYANGISSYGVHDMSGNAAEWINDLYQPYRGNSLPDKEYGEINRVVRGGSFRSNIDEARTTKRFFHTPNFKADEMKNRSWLIGFRCAIAADDPRLKEALRKRVD